MRSRVIVDTGVLVVAIDRGDAWAEWVADTLKHARPPMVTCEAVLAEPWFLLQHGPDGWNNLVNWLELGLLKVDFSFRAFGIAFCGGP